ncbi:MAG: Asp-tRNA(Asn)/Glu-tRNA(Gln) amidotransferase subunit GatB [Betaproteobacteria bacterium]|nr:Asp-tRNA(Asn)/Glu-tRNA(Gln) amidotransferase subunit GatB [Betaproteobacteria bacterium]
MKWEVVIGLETHAQLSTASKIFSGASTAFGAEPNTQACAVDLALPGVLPVLNKGAVERAIRFGLAVDANINRRSVFARKNYFYPDLPKGYQISQYELPVVEGGSIKIHVGEMEKTVRLTRAHLEEDAGKSLHEDFQGSTGIDLNRAGTPLLEIVSEPDMRSAAEAVAYAKKLHALVRWIDICDGNMQEGSFRCDANVSVRPEGSDKLGTRCEIKNLNSFRFLEQAINFEVRRQIEIIEDGGKIVQETRLYDPDKGETRSMRSKEDAHDYRYFPDPDLLPLEVTEPLISETKENLPELPDQRQQRYVSELGLSHNEATALTANRDIGDYFESVALSSLKSGESLGNADFKLCANWVINDIAAKMNEEENLPSWAFRVSSDTVGRIILRIREGAINARTGKNLLARFWEEGRRNSEGRGNYIHGGAPDETDEIIREEGLGQVSDAGAIEKIVDEVLAANAQQVADYQAGKEKAFNSLVGQAMKATKGKANPQQVNEILKRKLAQ